MEDLHIALIGCGNIGTHLVPEVPRVPGVAEVTLCDPDTYSAENLAAQTIDAADVGRGKAVVQAERLRRISPILKVNVLEERVENVPRWLLKCDLILNGTDNRGSRQHLNELACRLGVRWIDGGILGAQSLVRVNAYVPALDAPCLECNWGHQEYAALEQEYICGAVRGDSFPSMASSALGALVASLMTIEAAKILRGDLAASLASRQLVFDAQNHRLQITAGRRNPWCRWDHRTWVIEPWDRRPDTTALGDALDIFGCIRVEGHRFVTELICPGCGRRENALRLNRPPARCAACNRRMVTAGFGSLDRLDRGLAGGYTNLTLSQIGLRAGDIITGGDQRHRIQHRLLEAA